MNDETSASGADNLKLIIAGMLLLGLCATILGVIPVAVLVAGLVIAWRGGDISNVRMTTRFIQCLLALAVGILLVLAANAQVNIDRGDYWKTSDRDIASGLALAGIILIVVLEVLWLRPLCRQLGRFRLGKATALQDAPRASDGPSIMARESLAPYSTADELLKWSQLRDQGVVSEEEFAEARSKILGGH